MSNGVITLGPPGVQSTTLVTPALADETSASPVDDAAVEDPPVRTGLPSTAIAQVLAAGAGAHTAPDPAVYDPSGRPRPA